MKKLTIVSLLTAALCAVQASNGSGSVLLTQGVSAAGVNYKTYNAGRMDADECETRKQTLTVYEDGTYKFVAVHHNHSKWADDGDTHRLTIVINGETGAVDDFGSSKFVPRGKDRTKSEGGYSREVKRKYNEIIGFTSTLECD